MFVSENTILQVDQFIAEWGKELARQERGAGDRGRTWGTHFTQRATTLKEGRDLPTALWPFLPPLIFFSHLGDSI